MPDASIAQLVESIHELLARISEKHDAELDSLRKENQLLAAQSESACGIKAQAGLQQGDLASEGGLTSGLSPSPNTNTPREDTNPDKSGDEKGSCVDKSTIVHCGNSTFRPDDSCGISVFSNSTRRPSSSACPTQDDGSRRNSSSTIQSELEQHPQFPTGFLSVPGPSDDASSPKRRYQSTHSQSSNSQIRNLKDLASVQMSARLRVPRKSLKNVVASEPSQTGDAILPSFISSPTPGTSAQGDESGLSTPESSDNEDVQPEGRVACRNFSFVNNMFPSQGSGHDMNVKNGDSESVHDDVDVELCAVWKGRTRSLGRIAQRALLHQKILAPLPTLPMYPSAGSGVAQHFKGTCWRVLYKVWSRMVARPSSQRRLMWDFMGMALIGYDVIVIPLSSFDPPPNLFTHTMGWVCTIYWTIDIPCTLLVGYHTKGSKCSNA